MRKKLLRWLLALAVAIAPAEAMAQAASGGPAAVAPQIPPFAASPTSSVTRPANTTQYTANTGWCHATSGCTSVFTFSGACRANGTQVLIPQIDIWTNDTASSTGYLQGVLWLFNAAPGTVIADDAAFDIAATDFANLANMTGIPFTLGSLQSAANNAGVSLVGTTYVAQCAPGSTTIDGMVQVVNIYTPTSAEVLNVTLHTEGAN